MLEQSWIIAEAAFAGFYVGMAVLFSVRMEHPPAAPLAYDIGLAFCLSIWPLPLASGIVKGLLSRRR